MPSPLVSIIVPCYNQGEYIEQCLKSILDQTYNNWECIIIDDGSKDNSKEIIEKWVQSEVKISSISIANQGVSAARNIGIRGAKGVYILPLDADDYISNTYVENCVHAFEKNNELTLVYANAEKFGDINGFWELPSFSLRELCKGNMIYNCAMYRKSDFTKVGEYDEHMLLGLEDWEFWIRLLKNKPKVYKIPEVSFYYRIKKVSRNNSYSKDQEVNIKKYISKKHVDLFMKELGDFPEVLKNIDILTQRNADLTSKFKPTFKNRIRFLFGFK